VDNDLIGSRIGSEENQSSLKGSGGKGGGRKKQEVLWKDAGSKSQARACGGIPCEGCSDSKRQRSGKKHVSRPQIREGGHIEKATRTAGLVNRTKRKKSGGIKSGHKTR